MWPLGKLISKINDFQNYFRREWPYVFYVKNLWKSKIILKKLFWMWRSTQNNLFKVGLIPKQCMSLHVLYSWLVYRSNPLDFQWAFAGANLVYSHQMVVQVSKHEKPTETRWSPRTRTLTFIINRGRGAFFWNLLEDVWPGHIGLRTW